MYKKYIVDIACSNGHHMYRQIKIKIRNLVKLVSTCAPLKFLDPP